MRRGAALLATAGAALVFAGCATRYADRKAFISDLRESRAVPPAPVPVDVHGHALTLGELVAAARSGNLQVQEALARVEQADAQVAQAWTAFIPVLAVASTARRGDLPGETFVHAMNQHAITPTTNFNAPGWRTNFRQSVRFRYVLFAGGAHSAWLKAARQGREAAAASRSVVRQEVSAAAARLYYRRLQAQGLVNIAGKRVEALRAARDRARALADEGLLIEADYRRIGTQLASAKQAALSGKQGLVRLDAALSMLLGEEPGAAFRLAAPPAAKPAQSDDYTTTVREAYRRRPELEAARREILALQARHGGAKGAAMPTVFLDGAVNYDDARLHLDHRRRGFQGGVTLEWGLFSWVRAGARAEEVAAQLRDAVVRSRRTLLRIAREVRDAVSRQEEARGRLDLAETGLSAAQAAYDAVLARYEEQLATTTDLLASEAALNNARVSRQIARWDVSLAEVEVQRASGALAEPTATFEGGQR